MKITFLVIIVKAFSLVLKKRNLTLENIPGGHVIFVYFRIIIQLSIYAIKYLPYFIKCYEEHKLESFGKKLIHEHEYTKFSQTS